MSSQTPNLNLVLPVGTEKVSRQIINDNNTKIDTAVGANSTAITNLSNKVSKEVTNLNDQITNIPENGNEFAYYASTASNKPGVNSGYVQATKIGNWALQFAVDLEGTPYTRYKNSGGTISAWQELVTKNNQLRTLTLLFEFTGTSAQQITVSGSKNIDEYTLLQFDLYDTNGNIIASLCASPLMLRGIVTHYVYGASTSIWGSFSFANGTKNLTVNRTSSTTSKFRCYGID